MTRTLLMLGCAAGLLSACGPSKEYPEPTGREELGFIESGVDAYTRRMRSDTIRVTAAVEGLTNGLVIAGVVNSETGFNQCYSEATQHCQGPYSPDCKGPVLAGSGDGPCSAQEGGLGMFQFDSGTYSATMAAHGDIILSVHGNADKGVDFIINKVWNCPNTPNFNSRAEVIAWINTATPGTANFSTFMAAMAYCYRGCVPGSSCHVSAKQRYTDYTNALVTELGNAFWYGAQARVGYAANGTYTSAIATCYSRNGGLPTAGLPVDNGGTGHVHPWGAGLTQDMVGGSFGPSMCMLRNGTSTAYMVRGEIRRTYMANGGGEGFLGFPTSDEFSNNGTPRQNFVGGYITWNGSAFQAYR